MHMYIKFENDPLKSCGRFYYTNYNSVNIGFIFIETPNAQLQYVYQLYARLENDPFKTVWGDDYTNFTPYHVKAAENDYV